MTDEERVENAVKNTFILRYPYQTLDTFGVTNIEYFILTHPTYDVSSEKKEIVMRTGHVIASKPQIITPYYMAKAEGFSIEATAYFSNLKQAPQAGILYTYKNEPGSLEIVEGSLSAVAQRVNRDLDNRSANLSCIISGDDNLWDVSLMKFIIEYTTHSIPNNFRDFQTRHLIDLDNSGIPKATRIDIERLFEEAEMGSYDPNELKEELDKWNLFEEYESRFYNLFR